MSKRRLESSIATLFGGRIAFRRDTQRFEHFESQTADVAELADTEAARRAGRRARTSTLTAGGIAAASIDRESHHQN